ncbi:unnamed protein product [Brachionus calyciflorus]|uniref:Uncharacterized protein n=1 Tax=Brachionus calyciflorus TaxID=104777 RepID=A0A813U0T0_9BILA|nr:unnamed protein product [Brachionus calyciflorus]
MNSQYSSAIDTNYQSERERIENLLEEDFPFVYFWIHSIIILLIGLVEAILAIESKSNYGPDLDIGFSLLGSSFLVVLGFLSILLIFYRSYSMLKVCLHFYCVSLITNISGLICLNIVNINRSECSQIDQCKIGSHVTMLIFGIVSLIANVAHVIILETRYF